jgi:hypothetical protein
MSEDTHYTPGISEFHIGFEFEYKQNNKWEKAIFGKEGIYDLGGPELCQCENRVKYLAKEDIEKFGFVFLPEKSLGNLTLRFEIKNHYERIDKTEGGDDTMWWNVYLTFYSDRRRVFIKGDISDGSTEEKFFEGEVKNKSELKKLLTQLGTHEI